MVGMGSVQYISMGSMNKPFEKIFEGFKLSWDIRELEKRFIEDQVDPEGKKRGYHTPYFHPSGRPHWQKFPTNILFSRNFESSFPVECLELLDNLKNIQAELKTSTKPSAFTELFLQKNFVMAGINIIKILPGVNVDPHCDTMRLVSVNIGLVNSNTCKTHISFNNNKSEFHTSPKTSYIMNDGDIYMVLVNNTHSVESLVSIDSNLPRYIISYNMINRRSK